MGQHFMASENNESLKMSGWEKLKIISNAFAAVIIPIAVAWIGYEYTQSISEREIQGKFVELAVDILRVEPKSEDKALREWGTQIINKYSGVPLTKELRKELIDKTRLPKSKIVSISSHEKINKLRLKWKPVFDFVMETFDSKISELIKKGVNLNIDDKSEDVIIYDADKKQHGLKSLRSVQKDRQPSIRVLYIPGAVREGFLIKNLEVYFFERTKVGKEHKVYSLYFSEDSVTLDSDYGKYDRFDTHDLDGFLENSEIRKRIVEAINLYIESSVNR